MCEARLKVVKVHVSQADRQDRHSKAHGVVSQHRCHERTSPTSDHQLLLRMDATVPTLPSAYHGLPRPPKL